VHTKLALHTVSVFTFCILINETDTGCPVDDEDEEVCGSDGITYQSVCRLFLESDGVYVKHDGPCNQTECVDAEVSV